MSADAGLPAALHFCAPSCRLPGSALERQAAILKLVKVLGSCEICTALSSRATGSAAGEQVQRWLLQVASSAALPAAQAELVGHALGVLGHVHKPQLCLPTMNARDYVVNASHLAADALGITTHKAILLTLHRVLTQSKTSEELCRVLDVLHLVNADNAAREIARHTLDALRSSRQHDVLVDHLMPFMSDGAKGQRYDASPPVESAPVWDPSLWTAMSWPRRVTTALMLASSDPLLRICAPLAEGVNSAAVAIFPFALAAAGQQPYAGKLGSAINMALRDPSCDRSRASEIIGVLYALHVAGSPIRGLWDNINLMLVAEAAAQHRLDFSSLYFIDATRYHCGWQCSWDRSGWQSVGFADFESTAGLLRTLLPRLDAIPDVSRGLNVLSGALSTPTRMIGRQPATTLAVSDAQWRGSPGALIGPSPASAAANGTRTGLLTR